MSKSLKVAIVTGGSRGLGRSTVLGLAERGVSSIFTYNSNKAEADKVVALVAKTGQKAVALQLDTGKGHKSRAQKGCSNGPQRLLYGN